MMASRNLLNLVLLGIVGILILVVMFEPGKAPEKKPTKLTALSKAEVTKISIKRTDKQDVQFEKAGDGWVMTTPYQLPANDFRVDSILRLVETTSHAQHDITQLDKAEFKLDKPSVVVTFNDSVTVAFGGNEPLKHHRYVQVGQTLHLVSDTVYYHVSGKPNSLVSLQLLPKGASIKAIELPDNRLSLEEGRWQIAHEPKDMASDAVTRLLNEWKLIQALDVMAAKDQAVQGEIKLFLEAAAEPIVFSIVQRKPDFVLLRKDKGVQYQLTEDSAERLLQLARQEPVEESLDEIEAEKK